MKIVKTKVNALARQLSGIYNVEESQDIQHHISDELAKILQEEIAKEIIHELKAHQLVNEGWIMIPFTMKISIDWFKENIHDEYAMILGKMYFKSPEDAVLYSLTWSDKGIYYD
jgi:dihydroxyacetone kinase-like predicted kinase